MDRLFAIAIAGVLLGGCNSKPTQPAANSATATASPLVTSKVDPCSLLTTEEIKAVQGDTYSNAQRSDRLDGDFIVAQCYYALPVPVNSVVINVTTARDGAGSTKARAFWETTFGKDEKADKQAEPQRDRKNENDRAGKNRSGERAPEGEEEGVKPEKISGVGDEAFWAGSRVGGALYVLKNDKFFRISVGGAGDDRAKLKKSQTLAQYVLKRL